METEQLLDGIFRGDTNAQQDFVKQYANKLRNRAKRVLLGLPAYASGTEVANSVMGKFLIKAAQNSDSDCKIVDITDRQGLDNFLYRSVMNRAINEKKKTLAMSRTPTRVIDDRELVATAEFRNRFGEEGLLLANFHCIKNISPESLNDAQRLALSQIREWLSQNRKQSSQMFSLEQGDDVVHEAEVISDMVHSNEEPILNLVVEEALEMLDPKTRAIVSMRLLGNYQMKQIANHFNLSEPTVRHRLEDAYKIWRRKYND